MPTRKPIKTDSFATQFAELEKIVHTFEEDDINIDRGVALFEKGLALAESLKKNLSTVENTIITLKKKYHLDESSEISQKNDEQ